MAKKTKVTDIPSTPLIVHTPVLLDVALLAEHPHNTNKQSKHVFNELKESILAGGFDEPLIVVPRTDTEGFFVVSGNHRYKAGKDIGYQQLPCIVRKDWDSVESEIQLVRRNYVRGSIDRVAFTETVNRLSSEQAIAMDVIMERMGFEDSEAFTEFYQQEKKKEARVASQVAAGAANQAQQIRMIDDIGLVVSELFAKYGNSVQNSFMIFPVGGKHHIYVQVTPSLKKTIDTVSLHCISTGLDINTVLGGLLQIGIHNSSFLVPNSDKAAIVDAGSLEGDTNLTLLVDEK